MSAERQPGKHAATGPGPSRLQADTRSLWLMRCGFVAVILAGLWVNPFQKPAAHLWMGIAILLMACWPLDRWLRGCGGWKIPLFPMHLFFYALCIGFAAFIDAPRLTMIRMRVDEQSYALGLTAAILGIVALYIGHFLSRHARGEFIARLAPRFPLGRDHMVMLFYPLFFVLSMGLAIIPGSALAQVVPSLRLFCIVWALCAAWMGRLGRTERMVVLFLFLPLEFIMFSGLLQGYLVGLLIYGEMVIICYAVCRGRIPWSVILIGVVAFAMLQPIKDQYRDIVWEQGASLSMIQRAELLFGKAADDAGDDSDTEGFHEELADSYVRLNHLVDTSAIIQATEISKDYRHGRTLLPIFTKWIPRAFWPGKPSEDLGNRWARTYGYLDPGDYVTSFNLPWLPEMFMNFGWLGIGMISLLVGLVIGLLEKGLIDRVKQPVEIAFAYVIAAMFFVPESNMSLMFGGMIINWIAIAGFMVALRLFLQLHPVPPKGERT